MVEEVDGLLLVAVDGTCQLCLFLLGLGAEMGVLLLTRLFIRRHYSAIIDSLQIICRAVDMTVTVIGGGFISDQ